MLEGGYTRFNPVLLTASSTVLGLVPLAVSLNINFGTLLSDLDPQLFFGGDSSAFWEPLAWSIIFGLSFATVITLIFVPFIYYYTKKMEKWFAEKVFKIKPEEPEAFEEELAYDSTGPTTYPDGNGQASPSSSESPEIVN